MQLLPHVDPKQQLRAWRTGIDLSQAAMAELMGLPLRTYEDIEAGRTKVRPIHVNAAVMALIEHAAAGRGADELPVPILELVKRAAR